MPPLYNAYETKLLNVLHSKLCKEEKEKENDLIILGDLPLLKKDGLFSGATSPHTHTVYFHGRPALKLTLVYFHGRPTHTCSSRSIFTATSPQMFILVYLHRRPALPLTLIYFHGRPTHTCSYWSILRGDRPTWSIFMGDLPFHSH